MVYKEKMFAWWIQESLIVVSKKSKISPRYPKYFTWAVVHGQKTVYCKQISPNDSYYLLQAALKPIYLNRSGNKLIPDEISMCFAICKKTKQKNMKAVWQLHKLLLEPTHKLLVWQNRVSVVLCVSFWQHGQHSGVKDQISNCKHLFGVEDVWRCLACERPLCFGFNLDVCNLVLSAKMGAVHFIRMTTNMY